MSWSLLHSKHPYISFGVLTKVFPWDRIISWVCWTFVHHHVLCVESDDIKLAVIFTFCSYHNLLCGVCPFIHVNFFRTLCLDLSMLMCVMWFLFVFPAWYFLISVIVDIFYWFWKILSYYILGSVGKMDGECVSVCAHLCPGSNTHAHMRPRSMLDVSLYHSLPWFLRQALPVTLKLAAVQCRRTASRLQGSLCLCLLCTGGSDMLPHLAFLWVWGPELRASCLYSKCFSSCAIHPSVVYLLFFSVVSFFFFWEFVILLLLDHLSCSLSLYFSLRLF